MRKFTLLIISVFLGMAGFSQISINSNEVVSAGDIVIQANDDNPDPSITPGDAGGNMMWDFTALTESTVDTSYFLDPADTPFGSSFPQANLAMNATDTGFMYMIKNTEQMSWVGMVIDMDLITMDPMEEITMNVVPEDVVAEFPIEYGNTMNDSYYMMFELASPEPGIDSVRFKMTRMESEEIDAWGQLSLPIGTYNVLRSHISTSSYDSIWFKSALGWTFAFSSEDEYESYNFWSDDPGTGFVVAVLSVNESGEVESVSYLKDEVIQNVYENRASDIDVNIYPNPVESNLHLDFAEPIKGKVRILDLTGQVVDEKMINGDKLSLDLEQQSDGVYFYEISGEDGYMYRTGKIVKQQ